LPVEVEEPREHAGCRCGEILQGKITPVDCPLFATVCTPEAPVGACMVSSEGTCAAAHKYGR
ncbi:MAG TPA: hydrogenase formation protein HypD, partial [Geobacteraceae bacterium]